MTFPTSNIFGKINCRSQYITVTNSIYMNMLAGDFYTSLYKFLSTLSNSYGITELVTMNTGSGGTGVGYWDNPVTSSRFGRGPFSVWRFKPYQNRTWDWYFYMHSNTGSTAGSYEETTAQTPTKPVGVAALDTSNYRSVIGQAAFCFSASLTGSDSFNPWGGSISNGAATKSNPVWVSGSVNNTLAVFPRQNNLSGSNTTIKDNCMILYRSVANQPEMANTYHFWSDGHSLITANELPSFGGSIRQPHNANINYFGPFNLIDAIPATNVGKLLGGTGSLGFCVWKNYQSDVINGGFNSTWPNTPANYQSVGQVTNSTINCVDGGMFVSTQWGVRNYIINVDTSTTFINGDPSSLQGWYYLETPIIVNIAENGLYGSTGQIDTPLIRMVGWSCGQMNKSKTNQRMIFGIRNDSSTNGNTAFSRNSATLPWPSGSMLLTPMGVSSTNADKDGQDFVFLNYTGIMP